MRNALPVTLLDMSHSFTVPRMAMLLLWHGKDRDRQSGARGQQISPIDPPHTITRPDWGWGGDWGRGTCFTLPRMTTLLLWHGEDRDRQSGSRALYHGVLISAVVNSVIAVVSCPYSSNVPRGERDQFAVITQTAITPNLLLLELGTAVLRIANNKLVLR